MKVLVTGAGGYIGGWLSWRLAEQGHEVYATTRTLPENSEHWQRHMAAVLPGDLRNDILLRRLADLGIEAAVHTAALDQIESEKDVAGAIENNVTTTAKLLKALVGRGLVRFLNLSSQQVYGVYPSGLVTEGSTLRPNNVYALTHRMSEEVCRYYAEKSAVSCINLRCANGYGAPRLRSQRCWRLAINDFCRSARRDGTIGLLSDGLGQRDFIHVLDIASAIECILTAPPSKARAAAFNIGSGQTRTVLEVAHLVATVYERLYARKIDVFLPGGIASPRPTGNAPTTLRYDVRRLQRLGYHASMDLEAGIADTLQYLDAGIAC